MTTPAMAAPIGPATAAVRTCKEARIPTAAVATVAPAFRSALNWAICELMDCCAGIKVGSVTVPTPAYGGITGLGTLGTGDKGWYTGKDTGDAKDERV